MGRWRGQSGLHSDTKKVHSPEAGWLSQSADPSSALRLLGGGQWGQDHLMASPAPRALRNISQALACMGSCVVRAFWSYPIWGWTWGSGSIRESCSQYFPCASGNIKETFIFTSFLCSWPFPYRHCHGRVPYAGKKCQEKMTNAGIENARWSQEGGSQSSLGSFSPQALPLGGWRVRRRNY